MIESSAMALITSGAILVPITLFGIGIIASATISGLGIQRCIEAKNRG